MATRRISDHPLHVLPEYVGAELGAPWRRILAFVLDALLLIVPTLAVGLGAAAAFLHHDDPAAYAALRLAVSGHGAAERTLGEHGFLRAMAPLLARQEARGLPPAAAAAVEEGDLDKAADLLAGYDINFGMSILPEEGHEPDLAPKTVMLKVEKLIPRGVRVIVLLGVPALYFAFFTRRGATVGKWLAGLRVVRLDGEPLSWGESLERFAGYLHVPGTFFVSLRDMWHDPNRRMPHDRVVHTAVIRTVKAARR